MSFEKSEKKLCKKRKNLLQNYMGKVGHDEVYFVWKFTSHQVLQCADKWSANTALVQLFGISQINYLINHLKNRC